MKVFRLYGFRFFINWGPYFRIKYKYKNIMVGIMMGDPINGKLFVLESRKEKKCVLYLLLYESVVFLFPIDEGRNEMKRRDEKSGDTEWWPSTLSRIFPSVRGSSTRTWLNPLCSYRVDS